MDLANNLTAVCCGRTMPPIPPGLVFRPLSRWERVRVREGWGPRRSPLTPALSRWESDKNTRITVVSEKSLSL
jgi:hypothetical protein